MSGVNKAILLGHLGRDPEIRYTQGGSAVCNFSVATSESYTPKDGGDRVEKTEWHNIVAFDKLAEICGEYLYKGKQVYIEGRIQTSNWEKDGVKHYKTEIIAYTMQMIGGGDKQDRNSGGQQGQENKGW